MTDLVTFINETAIIVTGLIPLQSLDDALILVQAYISDVGGWVPDDPLFPEGDGQPANGFTEQQSAEAIAGKVGILKSARRRETVAARIEYDVLVDPPAPDQIPRCIVFQR